MRANFGLNVKNKFIIFKNMSNRGYNETLMVPGNYKDGSGVSLKTFDNHFRLLNNGLLSVARNLSGMHTKVTDLDSKTKAFDELMRRVTLLEKTVEELRAEKNSQPVSSFKLAAAFKNRVPSLDMPQMDDPPVVESVAQEPAVESVAQEPAVEVVPEPETEVVTEPAVESVPESVTEHAVESVPESVTESEPVTEPEPEVVPEPVPEPEQPLLTEEDEVLLKKEESDIEISDSEEEKPVVKPVKKSKPKPKPKLEEEVKPLLVQPEETPVTDEVDDLKPFKTKKQAPKKVIPRRSKK